MERETTLRDYARILWSGRWLLLAATVAAALIGLLISATSETRYTAQALVYMGLATTAGTGQPVSTPLTTPVTAQKMIRADRFVEAAADAGKIDTERARDGVAVTVERIPGAAGGNQPTIATLRYTDTDRATAVTVVNGYAQAVFGYANDNFTNVVKGYEKLVADGQARIDQIGASLDRLRAQGEGTSAVAAVLLQNELATRLIDQDENALRLAKAKQIETPSVITTATSASASRTAGAVLRATIFGAILGLIAGALAVFVWKGSPTERAEA